MRVLVTGGAGYIGSHMIRALLRAKHEVVAVDDLSAGHREAVPSEVPLFVHSVRDKERIQDILGTHRVEAVLHFASRIQVGESVADPRLYWRDNLIGAIELLEAMLDTGVKTFVLSSTAAVYGDPIRVPIDESHPLEPVNPYGATKLAIERMLGSYSRAYGLSYAALRYFNASGADVAAGIGERHDPETHLIPIVLETALGARREVTIYGEDYPTPDGTCIRDYIHVIDLVEAHLAALEYLARGGRSGSFNLGTGTGHSVREVIDSARRVTGREIKVAVGARRAGDPPSLVASPDLAKRVLGWSARRTELDEIVRDAWAWHSRGAHQQPKAETSPRA